MRTSRLAGAAAGFAAVALTLTACGPSAADQSAAGGDEIVFASIPSEESTSLQASYQPVLDMLAAETGKTVRFQQATDYAAVIEGQRAGKIDIAQYGPFSYVLAKNKGVAATAVAGQVEAEGEAPGYLSYGITRPDSGINGLADLRGKKVCFVDPTSTSGYLYPKAGLLKAGINPDTDIQPIYSGGHDSAALAVAKGDCDAGFAQNATVDTQLIEKGQLKPGELRTVWRSETVPGSPAAVSDELDPQVREKVTAALREKANSGYLRANGFCQGDCKLGDIGGWGYAPVDDAFYNGIRQVCDVTRDEQCQ
ncbi:phosphate/phosphite/phosphonate ABC transporter substrate-binding protein [Saccharopolyspora erythraea]|uniref:phosphate/phosphite/phosphonate ABC transporter substrate-binding protein n=1 Tax=Saccharopolyspora erythraea TaxID=1836 RepID=UPI001BA63A54|nr:phosphate/phosphite/phosphonate ABC transporter substrate-binding protein [Saccharopolyspora erythraea]QUH05031.1 phosphate/phosphite/phosphonate ABC transporter substrate-binding protein [Saccharopolyspora erythraea]